MKHGHARRGRETPTYVTWKHMRRRCYSSICKDFKFYGARGIKICRRWRSFANFLADMGEKPPGLTIDREDNDGNYEPTNCRWATRADQVKTKRGNFVKGMQGRRGADAPWAKLSASDVAEIRLLRGKLSQKKIGNRYGVCQSMVCQIHAGTTWRVFPA